MIISLRSKKIKVIRHVKQIIWKETYKSLDFWKIHSQNLVSIWFKNTYFQGKIFFQMVLKNFLSVVWPSNYIYIWDLKASFTLITTKAFTKIVFKTQPRVKDSFEVLGKLILVNKFSTLFSECDILGQNFGVP